MRAPGRVFQRIDLAMHALIGVAARDERRDTS